MNDQQTYHILILDKPSADVDRLAQLLKDSGYQVTLLSNAQEAYQFCLATPPNLIIFDAKLDGKEGLRFFRQIKNQYSTHRIPLVLTIEESDFKKRIELIEMGIDDFIIRPYYPEEVVARVGNLIQEYRPPIMLSKSIERGFVGSLKEMNLIDLIQTMELGNKSGIINLNRGDKEGQVYVNKGKIVDAVVGDYDSVERAYLHMLTWIEGSFYVVFQEVHLDSPLTSDNQTLFGEGAKVIDQWRSVIGELPSLHTFLVSVSNEEPPNLSYPEKTMLGNFQKPQSILQGIDRNDFDDFDGLKIIKSLLEKGLLIKTENQQDVNNLQNMTLRSSMKTSTRDAKSKYSHIFSIFQRNKRSDKSFSFQPSATDGGVANSDSKMSQQVRIKNNVQLTKAELLLIRQKLGK